MRTLLGKSQAVWHMHPPIKVLCRRSGHFCLPMWLISVNSAKRKHLYLSITS